jgi:hypothetical protein
LLALDKKARGSNVLMMSGAANVSTSRMLKMLKKSRMRAPNVAVPEVLVIMRLGM